MELYLALQAPFDVELEYPYLANHRLQGLSQHVRLCLPRRQQGRSTSKLQTNVCSIGLKRSATRARTQRLKCLLLRSCCTQAAAWMTSTGNAGHHSHRRIV